MSKRPAKKGAEAASLFISYRRDDTQSFARDLHKHLAAAFGFGRVFMDTVEIRAGDDWENKLNQELARSTVVIALIGPSWLSLQDDDHRRRIDGPEDWVRRELTRALKDGKEVIPIYVGGAELIKDSKKLPAGLARLPRKTGIELTKMSWDEGMTSLTRRLEKFGLSASRPNFRLPTRLKMVEQLSQAQISAALKHLPGWSLTSEARRIPNADGLVPQTELYREYAFDRFEDATAFMAETSAGINKRNHHPRWENFWTTVRVWLSTWDIEFKPSKYDVKLAAWLDKAYLDFRAGAVKGARSISVVKSPREETNLVRLNASEIKRRLAEIPAWTLRRGILERSFRFDDFPSAFGFMSSVALEAEALGHHPFWFNHFDDVRIRLKTESVQGISVNDFRLAERIDALSGPRRLR